MAEKVSVFKVRDGSMWPTAAEASQREAALDERDEMLPVLHKILSLVPAHYLPSARMRLGSAVWIGVAAVYLCNLDYKAKMAALNALRSSSGPLGQLFDRWIKGDLPKED